MSKLMTTTYQKHNSFESTRIIFQRSTALLQLRRASSLLENFIPSTHDLKLPAFISVLTKAKQSLNLWLSDSDMNLKGAVSDFSITSLTAEEMACISDEKIPLYIYHRYRYEVFPKTKELDLFPPYVQIEPSSVCNYRCTFCYQTDVTFSQAGSAYMGTMDLGLYRDIIDCLVGKVEFLSLASRGEPILCKHLSAMLSYSARKFLNLKINTNASLLTEELCHSLLAGGARTIVFSIDAPTKSLYESLRVNGRIERIQANLKMFKQIRDKHYSRNDTIARVSGVYVDEQQNMEGMVDHWGEYVDQITFVKYNPWENVYEAPLSNVNLPCSDLWRRLFIWYDGKVNPCDTDYKSKLSVGTFNRNQPLQDIWNSIEYSSLRQYHQNRQRSQIKPCQNCVVL